MNDTDLPPLRTHGMMPREHVPLDMLPDGQIHIVKQVLAFMAKHAVEHPECPWMPVDLAGEVEGADRRWAESAIALANAGLVQFIKVFDPSTGGSCFFARVI